MTPISLLEEIKIPFDPRLYVKDITSSNGFLYASNGGMIVRMPYTAGIEAVSDDILHKFFISFERPEMECFKELPEIPQDESCVSCHGAGRLSRCPSCEGTGVVVCAHCGHEEKCYGCGGDGFFEFDETLYKKYMLCTKCKPVVWNEMKFTRAYLAAIRKIPGVKYTVRGNILFFFSDGVEGIIAGRLI